MKENFSNLNNASPKFTGLNFIEACDKCIKNNKYVLQGSSFGQSIFAFYDVDANSFILMVQRKDVSGIVLRPITNYFSKSENPLSWTVTYSTANDTYNIYEVVDLIDLIDC